MYKGIRQAVVGIALVIGAAIQGMSLKSIVAIELNDSSWVMVLVAIRNQWFLTMVLLVVDRLREDGLDYWTD